MMDHTPRHDGDFGDEADAPLGRADLLLAISVVVASWAMVIGLMALFA